MTTLNSEEADLDIILEDSPVTLNEAPVGELSGVTER